MIYAEVAMHDDAMPAIVTCGRAARKGGKCCMSLPAKLPLGSRVTLVANTHRAVIRVAELPTRGGGLSNAAQWRLVEENFPLGPLLNADTHIFDGSIFENDAGRRCFMMAALPKAIAEPIGELAVTKWGSVHKLARLDTVEHMLFRHFAFDCESKGKRLRKAENPVPQWVVFPQSKGFRILYINNGLPQGAHYISNHPELRDAELERVWETAAPGQVVIVTRTTAAEMPAGSDEASDLPGLDDPRKAQWLLEYVQGKGLVVDSMELCCMAGPVLSILPKLEK